MNNADKKRLREIWPIQADDDYLSHLYDVERTFVIDIPAEFQHALKAQIAEGRFSDEVMAWLLEEGLLTNDEPARKLRSSMDIQPISDISLDISGNCNLACKYCFEKDIDSRKGKMNEKTVAQSLDYAFGNETDRQQIVFHFGSGETLLYFDALKNLVRKANERADATGRQVAYHLTTNATLVDREMAEFFKDNNFTVRVSCDGPRDIHNKNRIYRDGKGTYEDVEKGMDILLEIMPERVIVNSVITHDTRLISLWDWAREKGIIHFTVIKAGTSESDSLNLGAMDLNNFRKDLKFICDDIFHDLESGVVPIDYQPITKIIRKLAFALPITRFCGVGNTFVAINSEGKCYPCFRYSGLNAFRLGDVAGGTNLEKRLEFLKVTAQDVDSRNGCKLCRGRYLCGGGCYADYTVYGGGDLSPMEEHCQLWLIEIEAAIRFYSRLLNTDPSYILQIFGVSPTSMVENPEILSSLTTAGC